MGTPRLIDPNTQLDNVCIESTSFGDKYTMSQPNEQITAAPLKVDGVSDLDPDGRIPQEQLIKGTTGRIPRWPNFPAPPAPGQTADYTILYVYWRQSGDTTKIFEQTYTHVDDRPEFTFPITPQQMSVEGTAFLYYLLEGSNGNPDPSPERKLTIDHTLLPTLGEPKFPDVNFEGYLNCTSSPPISEKVRIEIFSELFEALDECVLEWQGFATLNGAPPELTPVYKFSKVIDQSDADNGFIMEIPFDPYVRPMVDKDSGVAQYTIYRNSIPVALSHEGLVKIDRIRVGEDEPCGGAVWKE